VWPLGRDVTPHVLVLDRKHQSKGELDLSYFEYHGNRAIGTACLSIGL